MTGVPLLVIAGGVLCAGYMFYGSFLARRLNLDASRATPAHINTDGVDYVPAKKAVLIGHHFASIAGAGPIVGPVLAAVFGWFPVYLWILVGGIFFGAVHDFTSIVASVRHQGRSIGEVIEDKMGRAGKRTFLIFTWTTLVLIIAVFMNVVAQTFVRHPDTASASLLFIAVAIVFGAGIYKKGFSLGVMSLIGVAALFGCIGLGMKLPLVLSADASAGMTGWTIILSVYIFIASVVPVWILLQPRDYLNSFLLYLLIAGALIGILLSNPTVQMESFTSFHQPIGYLFPILFVTVACGAISGFHSLVSSGTTAKQLDKETDAKFIGYGGMLIESFLAVIAMLTAVILTRLDYAAFFDEGGGGPIALFANGIGSFFTSFGIARATGVTFAALTVSAFAMTTLDTATRLGRYAFQEFFTTHTEKKQSIMATNRYIGTAVTVAAAVLMAMSGTATTLWPLFGSSNQLLAALALLAVSVWLASKNLARWYVSIPMVFMYAVTMAALGTVIYQNYFNGQYIVTCAACLLFILAVFLAVQAVRKMRVFRMKVEQAAQPV